MGGDFVSNAMFIIWLCCIAYIVLLPHMPDNYAYWCKAFMYAFSGGNAQDDIYYQ